MKLCTHITLGIFCFFVGGSNASADGWSRGVPLGTWPQSEAIKNFKPFELVVWSGDGDRILYGLCAFTNASHATVTIDGTQNEMGFYPRITAQVAVVPRGPWKTIGKSARRGKSAKVTVEPMGRSKSLYVDLEVFQSFMGKAKYGRLVLQNGDAATFELDTLTDPHK